jgi:competence protein ComEC
MRRALPAVPLLIALAGGMLPRAPELRAPRAVAALPPQVASSPFAVHFLDVGTGDSAIIDIGDQEIVIDGGDSIAVLNNYAARMGIIDGPIELAVVTHGDTDHWKGLTRLLGFDGVNPTPPGLLEFWEPGYDRDCRPQESYDTFIEDVQTLAGLRTFRRPLETTHPPAVATGALDVITVPGLPGIKITVLHTDATPPASNGECAYEINNASIVLLIEIFGHRFLFTGDENGKERDEPGPGTPGHIEKLLLDLDTANPGILRADVLKVPHHGSETASTQAFIDRVNPSFAIISASTKHHLPKQTVVDRYQSDDERIVLETDEHPENDTDHIICFQDDEGQLDCNFEFVLNET